MPDCTAESAAVDQAAAAVDASRQTEQTIELSLQEARAVTISSVQSLIAAQQALTACLNSGGGPGPSPRSTAGRAAMHNSLIEGMKKAGEKVDQQIGQYNAHCDAAIEIIKDSK